MLSRRITVLTQWLLIRPTVPKMLLLCLMSEYICTQVKWRIWWIWFDGWKTARSDNYHDNSNIRKKTQNSHKLSAFELKMFPAANYV